MKIFSIETTPNPHSIKINLDQKFALTTTFSAESLNNAPAFVEKLLLEVGGLKSIFICGDFITLNKDPLSQWEPILAAARALIEEKENVVPDSLPAMQLDEQSQVLVQFFKEIPIQVKAVDCSGETRVSLGERFNLAAQSVQLASGADFLKERYWADYGVRYGERVDIATQVSEELQGIFTASELERAVARALGQSEHERPAIETILAWLKDENWQTRLRAVQELSQSQFQSANSLLQTALQDQNAQVRRLAAAALGTAGSAEVVESLCRVMLNDKSIAVRRTAGDALSDIGEVSAQPAMCLALTDTNRLVRWRAARFLNDLGDLEAMPALEAALAKIENAYEVKLELEAAIARILAGSQGAGPAWRRMSESS